ncbi:hypothetical protein BVY03_03720 [bacterium K02(2017)]|nr:hypothetical protein BVY03_03720 [bacterium K02(2017)]
MDVKSNNEPRMNVDLGFNYLQADVKDNQNNPLSGGTFDVSIGATWDLDKSSWLNFEKQSVTTSIYHRLSLFGENGLETTNKDLVSINSLGAKLGYRVHDSRLSLGAAALAGGYYNSHSESFGFEAGGEFDYLFRINQNKQDINYLIGPSIRATHNTDGTTLTTVGLKFVLDSKD